MQANADLTGIAIIGMACRFPQAADLNAFWELLVNGREATQCFSDEELLAAGVAPDMLRHPDYVKKGLLIPEIDCFDAPFFGMSERDAEICDPQRRVFLECAYAALEDAGYHPSTHGIRTGVYAGVGDNHYLEHYLQPHLQELLSSVGYYRLNIMNSKDFIATDTAYRLNLTGPALTLQTACSTSLVAVHTACQSLLNFECDQALAGAISLALPQQQGYLYQAGMILSPDGHCRAFDADAQGTTIGGGVGIVVLKRLEEALADQDTIYAVIKGSAVNNDGADKIGFTAPSVSGQVGVILEAQAVANIRPDEISYIEAHGTGTPLGDPIEIEALTQAFGTQLPNAHCAIGSVKTNIGHADTAAGIAGLIKTVLALKYEVLPASLHFHTPNPQIDFAHSPFFVNNVPRPWKTKQGIPRSAGISSFGIGGTNAHIIVQEAPILAAEPPTAAAHLLLLSAKTSVALEQACTRLAQHLQRYPQQNLADVAFTLRQGRETFAHRRLAVCKTPTEAIEQLMVAAPVGLSHTVSGHEVPRIAFLLPGQGSQYAGMTRDLYHHHVAYRKTLDQCASILQRHLNLDIRHELFNLEDAGAINQTALTQPALFVVEYALAKLWMDWGIQPAALLGHSIGEYVAACLAGVFSLEDALMLVSTRGRLIQALPTGAMLAVPLSEAEAKLYCSEKISLAVINSPRSCVLAGDPAAILQLQLALHEQGIESSKLHTSHAFHSSMMEPALAAFSTCLQRINFQSPHIPYLSNVSGDWIRAEEATHPTYWVNHLRHTVRFADNLATLFQSDITLLLEVGPSKVLTSLARRHPDYQDHCSTLHTMPAGHVTTPLAETQQLLQTLGQLWIHGAMPNWSQVYLNERYQRVPLPSYPFERQRHWFGKTPTTTTITLSQSGGKQSLPDTSQHDLTPIPPSSHDLTVTQAQAEVMAIWQACIGKAKIGLQDDFFAMGGDSLMAVHIVSQLNLHFKTTLSVNDLLGHPTVAGITTLLEQGMTHEANAKTQPSQLYPLVALKKGGKNIEPLFLVHPAGGNLFIYKDLIQHIDSELPVFGFEALGLQEDDQVDQSIEDMANAYLAALLRFKPEGHYQLGGASSGGMVAFEMAQQLRQRGKQVTFLGLFDTPMGSDLPMETNNKQSVIHYFASLFADREQLLQTLQTLPNVEQQVDWLFDQLKQRKELPESMEIGYWRRLINVFVANINAVLAYKPIPYPDKLVFFRAQERRLQYDPRYPELPWLDLAGGGVTVHVVPGDHLSMFAEPQLKRLLNQLTPYLQGK